MGEMLNKSERTEIEELNQEVSEEKQAPYEEFGEAQSKRKRKRLLLISCFVLITTVVYSQFGYVIYKNDFQKRVLREVENRNIGKVVLLTGTYTGETDFGYFDGEGTFDFSSGSKYSGLWNDNKIEGQGELKVPIEGTYVGEFSGSNKNGNGTFTWDDGSVYTGEWKNDQMCGQGTYKNDIGVTYQGTFKDNLLWNGNCSFVNNTGNYNFVYQNGEIHSATILFTDGSSYEGTLGLEGLSGNGILKFASGEQYTGAFKTGKRSGKGTYVWNTGDFYDGDWLADEMNGTGKYTFANGNYADGTFSKNVFTDGTYFVDTGAGTYSFNIENKIPTGVTIKLTDGTTYTGDITNGELTGDAQINYSNGDTYNGKVSAGVKSGNGLYVWKSGAKYDGKWSDDTMNGNGTYYYPNGAAGYSLSGEFKNGRPDGTCQYYESAYTSYKTDWSNGSCVKIYE